jgi:serine protease Do
MARPGLLALALSVELLSAQETARARWDLSEDLLKSGSTTLRAFSSLAGRARESVVRVRREGEVVALGTIVDSNGLILTKASEIEESQVICELPDGTALEGEMVAVDLENDVGLLRVRATDLRPIEWESREIAVGQWAVTPGPGFVPEAVGIISVLPRKILHKRALIGVLLDINTSPVRISEIMAGFGAEKAGLKAGDFVLSVNETPVKEREELITMLRQFREGQTVQLRIQREEDHFDVSVPMMAPPAASWRGLSRGERMNRLGGELSGRAEGFQFAIQHDTVLQPWQCGGPLLNLQGRAIGLNIARAGRVASYALPARLAQTILEELATQARNQIDRELPVKQHEASRTAQ